MAAVVKSEKPPRSTRLEACYLCKDRFKDPKLLPCYHTFCAPCLNTLHKQSPNKHHFGCPLCDRETIVPTNGIVGLKPNVYLTATKKASAHSKKMKSMCSQHPHEENRIMCKDCNQTVCVLCAYSTHKLHDTILIWQEAKTVRDKVRKVINSLNEKENLQKLEYLIQRKAQEDMKRQDAFDNIIGRIRDQRDRMVETVNKVAWEAENSVENLFGQHQAKSEEDVKSYIRLLESFRTLLATAKMIVEQDDDLDILQDYAELCHELQEQKDQRAPHEVQLHFSEASYTEGMLDEGEMIKMMGNISDDIHSVQHPVFSTRTKLLPDIALELKGQFSMDAYVFGLAPVGDNKAWVYSRNIGLFDEEGNELVTTDVTNVNSIAPGFNSDCFASDGNKKSILHINSEGEVETIFSYYKEFPKGVTFRRGEDGRFNLLVCRTDKFKIYESSKGYVDMFTYPNGRTRKLYGGFLGPVRIASQPGTGLVAVSDYNARRVTIHNAAGQVVSQYRGEGQEDVGFKPYGLSFDNHGGLLVCNIEGGNVLRLSMSGQLLQVLLQGKNNVTSVAVDVDDQIWISFRVRNYGRVKVYHVK